MEGNDIRNTSSLDNSLIILITSLAIMAMLLMIVVVSYTIIMQRRKPHIRQASRNNDSNDRITRGLPLEMEFPAPRNLHNGRDSQEAAQSMPLGPTLMGGRDGLSNQPENEGNLSQSRVNIPPVSRTRNEPFHHDEHRSSRTNRTYPEALYHNPVMAYYIYESTDPHLRTIGHEYQDNILPLVSFNEKSGVSRGSSEIIYGHARYLSNSVISNIPLDEIVYYHGEGIQCNHSDYNPGDKPDSTV